MTALGIEFISVFGLPPVAFVELAADLGCCHISTPLRPIDYNPEGFPGHSLRDDPALRRELKAALRDRGVTISLGEGLVVMQGLDVREAYPADLDIMRELGAERISVVSLEPDQSRAFDQFAELAEIAGAVGIAAMLEFVPCFCIADLPTALAALRHAGRKDSRLVLDTMHLGRTGVTAAEIAALDPELIGYVQLCDVPLVPTIPDYMEEAMYQRLIPGEGEMPLREFLSAIPPGRVIGLEVPMRREAEQGIGPRERMTRCVAAARALLDEVVAPAE
jgi:sugar phosphate isomerase/epimerase